MPLYFGGSGVTPSLKLGYNRVSLAPGQTQLISPAGWYFIKVGAYTCLQQYDPILQIWVQIGGGSPGAASEEYFWSDGVNYRLANLTGLAVGALITNVGSGYTSAPAVTIASGNSIWRSIVGGSVATPTVSNGGSNYTYPCVVTFAAPPSGGVQATGYAVMSGGALSSITMVNVGAGYASPPTISISNDPREGVNGVTSGYGAQAVCTLTNAGQVTAILCTDPGITQYTSVPSFTFSGGGAGSSLAATPIMCWTILSFTPGGTNTGWGTTVYPTLTGIDTLQTISIVAASTNPAIQQGLVKTRRAEILAYAATTSLANTGSVFIDGGIYTTVPIANVVLPLSLVTTAPAATTVVYGMGGIADTSYISS